MDRPRLVELEPLPPLVEPRRRLVDREAFGLSDEDVRRCWREGLREAVDFRVDCDAFEDDDFDRDCPDPERDDDDEDFDRDFEDAERDDELRRAGALRLGA